MMTKEEQNEILKELDFKIEVSPEQCLGMKADLCLPWKKLRLMRRLNQLTWHDGVIPPNEIWIKLGGDKGGPSVKISFQIMNTEKPNSVLNSCVFSVFEAPDNVFNLHLALDRYHQSISNLQRSQWKGIIFICSCQVIMNFSAIYMAYRELVDVTVYDQLKIDQQTRTSTLSVTPRTLLTLSQKYDEFVQDGSNLKKAKLHDNVIGKAFINVPLSLVCPPGLHITLEEECHSLHYSVTDTCNTASNSFALYLGAKSAISSLQQDMATLQSEANQGQQLLALLLLTVTNPQQDPSIQNVTSLIHNNIIKIKANKEPPFNIKGKSQKDLKEMKGSLLSPLIMHWHHLMLNGKPIMVAHSLVIIFTELSRYIIYF
uniref:Uncharacterized protein n=1 Tax=Amphimedon queenslandica TaxID=400682 RepID=A0A1X7V618_AMPQE